MIAIPSSELPVRHSAISFVLDQKLADQFASVFEIPAGGSLAFQPGGKHIMLVELSQPLAIGDIVELTLNFAQAGPIMISVPVIEMGATEQEGTHDHGD